MNGYALLATVLARRAMTDPGVSGVVPEAVSQEAGPARAAIPRQRAGAAVAPTGPLRSDPPEAAS